MMSDYNDHDSYYISSQQQQMVLAILPKCTASIGLIGSLFVMKELYHDIKHGESNPIKRVLLGMTCYEMMSAVGWFLSSWMIPSSTTDFPFAVGTTTTCHLQGILLQYSLGAPLYHGIYTYFFFFIIQHDYSTERIEMIEGIVHIITMIFTSIYAIIMLLMKQYHPLSNGICWIGVVDSSSSSPNSHWYAVGLFYVIIWIIFITMILLHWHIRRRLVRTNHSKDDDDVSFMTLQGLYYCVAFVMTWLPMTLWSMKNGTSNGNVRFGWDVLAAFGVPLQGLWNALIFIQNRPTSQQRLYHIICPPCLCRYLYNNNDDDNDNDNCHDDDDGQVEVSCHASAVATSHRQDCCCCADTASITEAETSSHTYTSHSTITTLTTEQHPVVDDRAATIIRHHRSHHHNRTRRTTTAASAVIQMHPIDPTQDITVHFPEA